MRATIRSVEPIMREGRKTYYKLSIEGDDRDFSSFDSFKDGEEAEIDIKQNGDFWNIKRMKKDSFPKKTMEASSGKIEAELQHIYVDQKSDKELLTMMACNANDNAVKVNGPYDEKFFDTMFDKMRKAVGI